MGARCLHSALCQQQGCLAVGLLDGLPTLCVCTVACCHQWARLQSL